MKIRKVLVICGLLISVTASTFNVSAATARAAKDCTGTITLAKTSGTFKVTENNTPSNPVTAKKINGSYTSIDILGNKNTQQVTLVSLNTHHLITVVIWELWYTI